MNIGILSFLSPLSLIGLIALPVIWWLLRSTPPSPDRQSFPPTKILKELMQSETTAAHSPWWLTLLRLIVAGFIIFALAQPVLNSAAPLLFSKDDKGGASSQANGPVVIMVDNGWTAASQWGLRKIMMDRILRDAQTQERLVFLLPTAPDRLNSELSPLSALDAMAIVDRMKPSPFNSDHLAAFERLNKGFATFQNGGQQSLKNGAFYWLADGVHLEQRSSKVQRQEINGELKKIKDLGLAMHLISPDQNGLPFALSARLGQGGVLYGIIKSAPSQNERRGMVLALSGQEEVLGRVPFQLAAGKSTTEARIDLPLELRNQITKLKIEGESSAGSVYLLDQRSNWRRIGLISNESGQLAQPLLSPLYYIRRALEPYAELLSGSDTDVAASVESFTKQNVSVVVMADIGRLVGAPLLRLTEWVEKGGVLVRFAGPHMEESQDSLLPTPLRQGGRRLGGALSWSKPQALADFDEQSPFSGLKVPSDVFVTRQLLADPARLSDKVFIWARLKDGTPLVTATRELDGWVVLVHVTANSDWSNLPLSGLFVEMLQRLSQLSVGTQASLQDQPEDTVSEKSSHLDETAAAAQQTQTLLAPFRTLNGFGSLEKPPVLVEPLAYGQLKTITIGPKHPPGFYGPAAQSIALNLIEGDTALKQANYPNFEGKRLAYSTAPERALRGPLFVAALILLIIDSLVILSMRGVFSLRGFRHSASLFLIGLVGALLISTLPPKVALAQAIDQIQENVFPDKPLTENEKTLPPADELTKRNLSGALKTHLAYVVTGNSKVDKTSRDGLRGLSFILNNRTAVEPADPMAVKLEKDELAFYPILYWPVGSYTKPLTDAVAQRINSYMKHGGMIIFDTKDQDSRIGGLDGRSQSSLKTLLSKLDIPRIEPVSRGHVLTKSFYLLSSFPGRFQGGDLWVEAAVKSAKNSSTSTSDIDGVSTLIITSNDLASAWAVDENYQELYPVIPGGEMQREMAYRVGVNIVMYALAGNYKADQVHVPALLERLGQ